MNNEDPDVKGYFYICHNTATEATYRLPNMCLYDILQVMKEARNVIISVLLLLFILVGIGVAISRVATKEKETNTVKNDNQRGFVERIFFSTTPTPTPKKGGLTIVSETKPSPTRVPTPTKQAPAGASASTIPSTGPATGILALSLLGMSSGFLLKKRAH